MTLQGHLQENPFQLQPVPLPQGAHPVPIKVRNQFFPGRPLHFPVERGCPSLYVLISTVLSVEGQTLVSFCILSGYAASEI